MDRDFHDEAGMREQRFGPVKGAEPPISENPTVSSGFGTAAIGGALRNDEALRRSSNVPGGIHQRRRVCVLEDSYKNMRAIFRALKKDGHEVDHFVKPSDALIALEGGSYNALVVSDTVSAGARECDLLIARLRNSGLQEFAELTIVALTDDESDERRRALHDAGASRVLCKFTGQELSEAVTGVATTDASTVLRHNKRVLLLEDSYSLSQRLSDAFMSVGHEVDHVVAAEEALVLARSCRHDAIVLAGCDLGSLTREQLVGQLRVSKNNSNSEIPIAVLTAGSKAPDENLHFLAGADLVLARDADQLEFLLISWIQRSVLGAPSKSGDDELPTLQSELSAEDKLPSMHAPSDSPSAREQLAMQPPWRIEPRRNSAKTIAGRWRFNSRNWFSTAAVLGIVTLVAMVVWFGRSFMVDGEPAEQSTANIGERSHSIAVHGQVVSKRQIELPATQTGQIYRVYVQEGRLVRKGEKLATLDNREAVINVRRAEAQVYRFRTEIDFAERTLQELQAEGPMVASRQMVRDVQEGKVSAEAKLLVAEQDLRSAQLAVERLAIIAPFAGVTVRCYALEGRWVEPGASLYLLADLNALEMALRLDAENAHSFQNIRAGQTVRFIVSGAEWTEKVLRVSSESDFFAATNAPSRIFDGNALAAFSSLGEDAPALELDEVVSGAIVLELVSDLPDTPAAYGAQRKVSRYLNRPEALENVALASIGKPIRIE